MNENFKTPKIRFKGFTEDWEQRKLGEIIIDTIDNRGKNPPYYCESGIPIIDNFMIKNNGYPNLKIATRYLDDYLFNNFVRKYNELDDTLITLVGNGIGNIALFPKEKSAIIQNTLGMRFEEPKKFKYYSLLSKNNQIIKLDRGMAQPSIRQDELKDIDIELPIFDEQLKISRLMSNLDNLITLHQRKYDKLVNIKKSMLEKMFPKNDSKIPEIRFKGFTEDWEQRKFDDVITRISTGLNPRDNFVLNNGGNNYYVTIKNFTHGNLKLDSNCDMLDDNALSIIQKRSDLKKDDILFSSIGRIGDCYLLRNTPKNWNINESVFTFRPNKDIVYPEYLFHTIHSDSVLNQILNNVTGSTFKSIKIGDLKKAIIPITNKEEQIKLSKFISSIDNLITLHQRKLDKLNNFKKSMLEKMFV